MFQYSNYQGERLVLSGSIKDSEEVQCNGTHWNTVEAPEIKIWLGKYATCLNNQIDGSIFWKGPGIFSSSCRWTLSCRHNESINSSSKCLFALKNSEMSRIGFTSIEWHHECFRTTEFHPLLLQKQSHKLQVSERPTSEPLWPEAQPRWRFIHKQIK